MTLHLVGPARKAELDARTENRPVKELRVDRDQDSEPRWAVQTPGIDLDESGSEIFVSAWPEPAWDEP